MLIVVGFTHRSLGRGGGYPSVHTQTESIAFCSSLLHNPPRTLSVRGQARIDRAPTSVSTAVGGEGGRRASPLITRVPRRADRGRAQQGWPPSSSPVPAKPAGRGQATASTQCLPGEEQVLSEGLSLRLSSSPSCDPRKQVVLGALCLVVGLGRGLLSCPATSSLETQAASPAHLLFSTTRVFGQQLYVFCPILSCAKWKE